MVCVLINHFVQGVKKGNQAHWKNSTRIEYNLRIKRPISGPKAAHTRSIFCAKSLSISLNVNHIDRVWAILKTCAKVLSKSSSAWYFLRKPQSLRKLLTVYGDDMVFVQTYLISFSELVSESRVLRVTKKKDNLLMNVFTICSSFTSIWISISWKWNWI